MSVDMYNNKDAVNCKHVAVVDKEGKIVGNAWIKTNVFLCCIPLIEILLGYRHWKA